MYYMLVKIYSAYPHMEVLCNLHHLLHDNLRTIMISRSNIWFITRFQIYCKTTRYREYFILMLILLFHLNRFKYKYLDKSTFKCVYLSHSAIRNPIIHFSKFAFKKIMVKNCILCCYITRIIRKDISRFFNQQWCNL